MRDFPVAFYRDELADLPDREGPAHWHPYFEIATAQSGILEYQVGQSHVVLEPGDSIFVNQNMLHKIRQLSGKEPDPLPILVFSGRVIAPEGSAVYQKYVQPILACDTLPFIVFRKDDSRWEDVCRQIQSAHCAMQDQPDCYELLVKRSICFVWEKMFCNLGSLSGQESSRVQLEAQIRLQKMLAYIYENYPRTIALADIADAAGISRSEAGRCFQAYLGHSPVEALIRYRLQTARQLLQQTNLSLQEIGEACGFHSVNYFSRQFRKRYGYSPGGARKLGK